MQSVKFTLNRNVFCKKCLLQVLLGNWSCIVPSGHTLHLPLIRIFIVTLQFSKGANESANDRKKYWLLNKYVFQIVLSHGNKM